MKRLLSIILMAIPLFAMWSCGSDDDEVPAVPKADIILRSTSISEGAEVDAKSTTLLTLSYNKLVTVSSSANITLNGKAVTAKSSEKTAMNVEIALTLEDGMEYTLVVPEGAIVAKTDANSISAAFTLKFKTRKTGEQNLPDNNATALTKAMGFGWNLGNHFDTSASNDANGNPIDFAKPKWGYWDNATPTEALYKNLVAAGVKTVRIPVTWGPYQTNDADYTIDADYMNTVKQNVTWAKNAGLIVILNTHHDEYWMDAYTAGGNADKNTAIEARIKATWKQIAEAFKNEGSYLILEAFNELNHNWQTPTAREVEIQNEWNQLVVETIRATGGENATRWIAVPSYQASPSQALSNAFKMPNDAANKIIVAVHCYDPYNFTLNDPLSETFSQNDLTNVETLLGKLKTKFIDNNIPCYLGEFGCSLHKTEKENNLRKYYLEYFCRAAHFAGLPACLWDNFNPGEGAEHHAYFSHNDGSWMDNQESIVKLMIKALTSSDADYTMESIINKYK